MRGDTRGRGRDVQRDPQVRQARHREPLLAARVDASERSEIEVDVEREIVIRARVAHPQSQRGNFRTRWQQFFRDWDILICPISTTVAFVQDQSSIESRTVETNLSDSDRMWIAAEKAKRER